MKEAKLFIGPMSKNIVKAIIQYCNDTDDKIGMIPSRRQIDYNGGYVGWNTKEFVTYVKLRTDNIIIERDHSGIGQGEIFDTGTASQTVDAKYMDIIHIDPWKIYDKYEDGLHTTIDDIKYINALNNDCLFEVGTEQSIRKFEVDEFEKLLSDLQQKLGDLFNKIKYAVVQSGTELKGTKNIGIFEKDRLKKMIKICENFGLLSKEHNGDYLQPEDIKKRFDLGLSAINLAPEFGVFETDIILEHLTNQQKEKFFNLCYKSNKWVKWVDRDFNPFENKTELMRICGHYQFASKEYEELNLDLDNIIQEKLYIKIKKMNKL